MTDPSPGAVSSAEPVLPSEFDEAGKEAAPPVPTEGPRTRVTWSDRMSQKAHMRLLVGVPIVWAVLGIYAVIAISVIADWATIDQAKDLAGLLSVPGTLAAAVVGYFFARGDSR